MTRGEGVVFFFNSFFLFLSSSEVAVRWVHHGAKTGGVQASDGYCSGLLTHILVAWLEKFIYPIGRLGGWVGDSEGMEALL